jgi:hypothetical protein
MAFLDTTYKKKSTAITAIILIALLWMIFNFGMKYQDPPEEYGIAINFGTSNQGYEMPNDILPSKESRASSRRSSGRSSGRKNGGNYRIYF